MKLVNEHAISLTVHLLVNKHVWSNNNITMSLNDQCYKKGKKKKKERSRKERKEERKKVKHYWLS